MHGGETTAQDLSNESKTEALGKNLIFLDSFESLVTKKRLLQKSDLKVVLSVRVQKYHKATVCGIFPWHGPRVLFYIP